CLMLLLVQTSGHRLGNDAWSMASPIRFAERSGMGLLGSYVKRLGALTILRWRLSSLLQTPNTSKSHPLTMLPIVSNTKGSGVQSWNTTVWSRFLVMHRIRTQRISEAMAQQTHLSLWNSFPAAHWRARFAPPTIRKWVDSM